MRTVVLLGLAVALALGSCATAPKAATTGGPERITKPSLVTYYHLKRYTSEDAALVPVTIKPEFLRVFESTADAQLWFYGLAGKKDTSAQVRLTAIYFRDGILTDSREILQTVKLQPKEVAIVGAGVILKPGGLSKRIELRLTVDRPQAMMHERTAMLPVDLDIGDFQSNRYPSRSSVRMNEPSLLIGYGFGRKLSRARPIKPPFYNLMYDTETLTQFDETVLVYLDVSPDDH